MRLKRRSYRDDDDEDPHEELAAVNDRLDDLTRHIERIAEATLSNTRSAPSRREERRDEPRAPDHVTEALARLDRRLDQIIADTRASAEAERRAARMAPPPPQAYTPPPAPPSPPPGPASCAAEISARQRALDGGPQAAAPAPQWRQPAGPDLSGLEQHLRQITTQIASLHQPYEDALTALRGDLAEIGRALTEAMPRRAIEQLEGEIRTLAQRVDRSKSGGGDPHALAALEQGIGEIREALRHLMPAENLAGFEEVVRGLSRKIDQISSAAHDPGAFRQIEEAIHSMRQVVQNVASDGALAQLAAEVHNLAQHVEHAAVTAAQNNGVRVISYVDELTASAAYALACVAEEIYLPPSGIAGSVGVISTMCDQTQADEMAGLRYVTITSGARKADGHVHVAISDEAIAAEEVRVGELAEQFFALVEKARGIDARPLQANIYLAADAVSAGLADGVFGWHELTHALREQLRGTEITTPPPIKKQADMGTPYTAKTTSAKRKSLARGDS